MIGFYYWFVNTPQCCLNHFIFITGLHQRLWYNLEGFGIKSVTITQMQSKNCVYDYWDVLQSPIEIMTTSNGNIFRITGPLWQESTGDRWIPFTRVNNADFDVFCNVRLNKRFSKQSKRRWFDTPSRSLWRYCTIAVLFMITPFTVLLCFALLWLWY